MSFDIFKDSPLYQEIIQEAAREAAQEAAINALSELARAGLEGRFGPLPDDILQALNAADEAALKAALSSDTLAQVRKRLG